MGMAIDAKRPPDGAGSWMRVPRRHVHIVGMFTSWLRGGGAGLKSALSSTKSLRD
jgi:hypothetical protein